MYVDYEEILKNKEMMFSNGNPQQIDVIRLSNIECKAKHDLVDRLSYEVVCLERDDAQRQVRALQNRMRFTFGDLCNYCSPVNHVSNTKCVFIRDDGQKAVVMFENAEFAARVNYRDLKEYE